MGFLIAGTILFFITAVMVVLGAPYLYFLKRDMEWEAARATAKVTAKHPKHD